MKNQNRNVLITGGTGILGSAGYQGLSRSR